MELKEYFAKLNGGDIEAFNYIYSELKKTVFTIACRIVQSRETAEDITHDVFVKLYTSPPDSSVKNVRAWVFKMTRNLALDALKHKQHEDIDSVCVAAPDPTSDFVVRMDIEAAMARLSRKEREIVSLHLVGGLGFFEVSRIVGLSMPAVYRQYRKALSAIRNYLGGRV